MTHLPTSEDLVRLADAIARDGISTHQARIDDVARVVRQSGRYPGSAAVLGDPNAGPDQKARAFLVVCRNWREIAETVRADRFDHAVRALGRQWVRHQDLRETGTIQAIWESRKVLDQRRDEVTAARC